MRLSIRYVTQFTYDTAVSESQNALRARPVSDHRQELRSYRVSVDPSVAVRSHTDYWGTHVDCFGVVGRHTRLLVVADSVVTTSLEPQPDDAAWPPQASTDDSHAELLMPSPHVEWGRTIAEFARAATAGASSRLEAVRAIHGAVGAHMTYEPGTTDVGVHVSDVFEHGRGVCQDYAHLAVAAFRSIGVAARYVSGYLYANDASAGLRPEDDEVEVSTHAWVEVAMPSGWWGFDPTNQHEIDELHVKIGHGRDYDDVMPLRGVYLGDAESGGLDATVRISREQLAVHHPDPRPALVNASQQ